MVRIDPDLEDMLDRLKIHFEKGGVTLPIQIIKIGEELGEVDQAFIGWLALNPRKGRTHTKQDVVMELADVVVTALLAIKMAGYEPGLVLDWQMEKTEKRLNDYEASVPDHAP